MKKNYLILVLLGLFSFNIKSQNFPDSIIRVDFNSSSLIVADLDEDNISDSCFFISAKKKGNNAYAKSEGIVYWLTSLKTYQAYYENYFILGDDYNNFSCSMNLVTKTINGKKNSEIRYSSESDYNKLETTLKWDKTKMNLVFTSRTVSEFYRGQSGEISTVFSSDLTLKNGVYTGKKNKKANLTNQKSITIDEFQKLLKLIGSAND